MRRRRSRYEDLGLHRADRITGRKPGELGFRLLHFFETRAEIFEKLGRRDAAIADYRAALPLDADHQAAMEGLKRLAAMP
jgi:predicted RNA polymerase sigma factor